MANRTPRPDQTGQHGAPRGLSVPLLHLPVPHSPQSPISSAHSLVTCNFIIICRFGLECFCGCLPLSVIVVRLLQRIGASATLGELQQFNDPTQRTDKCSLVAQCTVCNNLEMPPLDTHDKAARATMLPKCSCCNILAEGEVTVNVGCI